MFIGCAQVRHTQWGVNSSGFFSFLSSSAPKTLVPLFGAALCGAAAQTKSALREVSQQGDTCCRAVAVAAQKKRKDQRWSEEDVGTVATRKQKFIETRLECDKTELANRILVPQGRRRVGTLL